MEAASSQPSATSSIDGQGTSRAIRSSIVEPRALALVGAAGVVLMIVGVFTTWTSGDRFTLNGVQGPNNGWLLVIYALIGAGAIRAVSRASWIGIVAILGVAAIILSTAIGNAIGNSDVLSASSGWGLWLTIAGGVLLAVAGALAIAVRLRVSQPGLRRTTV